MNKSYTSYKNIGKFLTNIGENWRNCIYITCSVCKHKKDFCCSDMLVSFDKDGIPVFISVSDASYIFATMIDKSECLGEMSNAKFMDLFDGYLKKYTNPETGCPFLQLARIQDAEDLSITKKA